MKKLIFFISLLTSIIGKSQAVEPVKWTTSVEKISETEYKLIAKATISAGWHLYAQNVPENGPVATSFTYDDSNNNFKIIGNTTEEVGQTLQDPVFGKTIKSFIKEAVFEQTIEFNSTAKTINGFVEFMAGTTTKNLPAKEVELEFKILESGALAAVPDSDSKTTKHTTVENKAASTDKNTSEKDLWTIFLLSFFSGFAALLTPCVFPMIPMTVSFFTKQSKTKAEGIRKAIFYGISIIAIYIFLGAVVTWTFGADSLNALSTNVWFNVFFFILLLVFAFSFLGAFEIMLPNSLANKVDNQADKGGVIGILFMALALAIVSFSCTGPIVGTLLVEAASRGGIAPFIGMFGFSLALALPFTLFAAFPGWMNSLPKSGGWLNTVKVFLGFLELALAFKFLSNADLVLQLHWLERETFLAIWIGIFSTLALYLFGKIQLPHDSPISHISVGRLSLGIIVLSFTIYLIPGIWGAPLKMISGFPPPLNYSEMPNGIGGGASSANSAEANLPEGAELGPHKIVTFTNYDDGMAYAKKIGKPAMIDFTGHACVNCRKMEDQVWSDEMVKKILKEDVVLISLYVDDKRKLPKNEQLISKINGKEIKYIGQKWSEFQTLTYKTNAQPLYVLVDHNGNQLNEPTAYNPDIMEYLNWLKKGINNFTKKQ
jgi:thiol:disulfide interchange protein